MRSPQDLPEDLSSHLLPSPSSQLRYRTTLTLQPSRGKTSFSCPSTENGALRVPSSEGWLSSAALKRGTSCSDAGNFKHWGWRWRTRADPESQSATRRNPLSSRSRACGAGQRPRGKGVSGNPAEPGRGPRGSQRREHQPPSRRPHFRLTASPEDDPLTLGTGT